MSTTVNDIEGTIILVALVLHSLLLLLGSILISLITRLRQSLEKAMM